MKTVAESCYNERLFSGGIRGYIHGARFNWLYRQLSALQCKTENVLEIGCYDGKALDFFPTKPISYEGFDAGWENAIPLAKDRWRNHPRYGFHIAHEPADMHIEGRTFDVAIALETLEHIRPDLVEPYLVKIATHLRGYFFVTVPNEKGPLFLAKWLAKTLLSKEPQQYSLRDVFNQTIGRHHLVERNDHKGFDYAALIEQIKRHFNVLSVSAVPLRVLPPWLSYGAGIVARSKV